MVKKNICVFETLTFCAFSPFISRFIFFLTLTDKPESVTITPLNATAVNVSWSGSTHLSTTFEYIVYCTSSGSVMSERSAGLQPGVSSTALEMEDDITFDFKYQHKFRLNYFDESSAPGPVTTTTFSFGNDIQSIDNLCADAVFSF